MILTDEQIAEKAYYRFPVFGEEETASDTNADMRMAFTGGMLEYRSLLTENRSTEERKEDFRLAILQYAEKYEPSMLDKFYRHWAETNKFGKMKFELQKTWSLAGRLSTWSRNDRKFSIISNLNKKRQ